MHEYLIYKQKMNQLILIWANREFLREENWKNSMFKCLLRLLMVVVACHLAACAKMSSHYPSAQINTGDSSLFERIGGLTVLTKIVDEFINAVAAVPSTKRSFDGVKLKVLKESVVAQLCKLTGGQCVYDGETMLNAHRDAKITEAEFDAFVSMFRDTLNKYVDTREKNELLKILAPMKRDIVVSY